MSRREVDEVTGVETTGHEWDGVKELNKPLPKWWVWTFYATIVWAIGYWIAISSSQRAYDRSLVEIARGVSLHLRTHNGTLALDMPAEARRVLFTDPVDTIYFRVETAAGRLVAGDPIEPVSRDGTAAQRNETFYGGAMDGVPLRIVQLRVDADPATGVSSTVHVAP